ncbi:heme-binding protein [Sphingorhabdus sp.]|uniref:SOUL family heme-binding protein n=1 Tax=Sphingorhabdus sp. TaxID=1902408 RepID=UPI003593F62B
MKSHQFALLFGFSLLGGCAVATEEPSFTVGLAKGNFEVRDYPALVVAEVSVTGDRKDAASKGFRLLAGYIFGGNTASQKIAMTAPVTQAAAGGEKIAMTAPVLQSGGDGNWVIRFIMPRGSTLETLPQPNDPKVHLNAVAPARMAVVRFSGLAQQDTIAAKTDELRGFVKAQNLSAIGSPSLAQYDPPWTLWFLRRNELMIPIERDSST